MEAALDLFLEDPRIGLGSGLTNGESCHEKEKGPDGSCKVKYERSGTPPVLRDSAMLASLGRAADAVAKTSGHENEGPENRQSSTHACPPSGRSVVSTTTSEEP